MRLQDPESGKIFIDGGHNGSAGVALSKWIKIQKKESKFYIIIGMMKNKNIEELNKKMKTYVNSLYSILEKIDQWDNLNNNEKKRIFHNFLNTSSETGVFINRKALNGSS